MDNDISPPVRDFIGRHIVSVEELELLLLLQVGKDREWTAAEINGRLRSQEHSFFDLVLIPGTAFSLGRNLITLLGILLLLRGVIWESASR